MRQTWAGWGESREQRGCGGGACRGPWRAHRQEGQWLAGTMIIYKKEVSERI